MSRRDKERIARIIAGEEQPHRHDNKPEPIQLVECKYCGNKFPIYHAEEHFKNRCTGRSTLPNSPGIGY